MGFDFSAVAASYATFRPRYPAALVDALAAATPSTSFTWEAGCGSGQLSVALAARFERVIATDPSAAQIREAQPARAITYRVAAAEDGIEERGADLCVVAQAAHWFDWPRYVAAVTRVGRPGALAAAIAYGRFSVTGDDAVAVVDHYYDDVLGGYWPPERAHIDNGYRDLVWPWPAVELPAIAQVMVEHWTRDETLGYLGTWSATNRYREAHGPGAFAELATNLARVWPDGERRDVRWPLIVRCARLP